MLIAARAVLGSTIIARDDRVGSIADIYFGGDQWDIRYLVADTGTWLPGRRILLSPIDTEQADWAKQEVRVRQTKQQIEDSPPIAEDEPVSRKMEGELAKYYEWPNMIGAGVPGITPVAGVMSTPNELDHVRQVPPTGKASAGADSEEECDTDLRSIKEVCGYRIEAIDGDIGHLEDVVIDDKDWAVRYLVVNTRNWLPGKSVLVAPSWAEAISWATSHVKLGMTRELIKGSPEYAPTTPVNRQFEERLYDYYGREKYWQ